MRAPIFILGSHKSGTSLLRSLFDGINGLFVVSVESHFFQCSGHWVDYALRRTWPVSLPLEQIYENFITLVRKSNTRASSTSDSDLHGQWDLGLFREFLRAKTLEVSPRPKNMRALMDHYIESLHVGLYRRPPIDERFLEKTVEHAEYATILQAMYPDAFFIHVVRNPYATLLGIRKHMASTQFPFLAKPLSALYNSYYHLYKNPLFLDKYFTVRYEDLVCKTDQVMRDIANFVEIDFSTTLLTPTAMGKVWGGNSTGGEKFAGISQKPLSEWKTEISSLEKHFVNTLFSHVIRDHQYEFIPEASSVYAPIKFERPRTYLMNRMLWAITCKSNLLNEAKI